MKKKKNYQKLLLHLVHYKESSKIILILLILFFFSLMILSIFDGYSFSQLIKLIKNPDADHVMGNLLANAGGEIIFGLLGIVMTVVAIIVELAANRYTARVSDLFVRDKVNMFYLILLSATSLNLVITLYISRNIKIPLTLINITTFLMTLSVITLVPYFIYVFKFLEPESIISKIEFDILKNAKKAKLIEGSNKKIDLYQAKIVQGVDQLTDTILNSLYKKDKILATNCIKSMTNFIISYIDLKNDGGYFKAWYHPSDFVRFNNADFVTLMDDSFDIIVKEKTWVEHKLFRQLNTVFQESLNRNRDICNYTAQCFYSIGTSAIEKKDQNDINLVIKFFNTLLRSSINNQDVRSCFNLFNQYKLFGQKLIQAKQEELYISIAGYFKYYGLLAINTKNMAFILETAAHDLCYLNKLAYSKGLDKKKEVLGIILNMEKSLEGETGPSLRKGIRKAQIILSCFYLSQNTKESRRIAKLIFDDILDEVDRDSGYNRIFDIIKELKYVKAEFWEIIDRGLNIDYIPPEQKKHLMKFLEWLNIRQILLYANYKLHKNPEKTKIIFEEFISSIIKLPMHTPIELKEFENIYGHKGIDNRINIIDHHLSLMEKLMDKKFLTDSISEHKGIPISNQSTILKIKDEIKKLKSDLENRIKILL